MFFLAILKYFYYAPVLFSVADLGEGFMGLDLPFKLKMQVLKFWKP
jgi:hypothetical protein